MNIMTDANVEVQPYAFTTKSVYVGHMDYKYNRWQVLDTPGILDHPLEQRNTIEMTAITALAHIHAAILFFLDVSEQCGFSIEQQVALFHSIKPLFRGKPLLVVLNKIDVRPLADLADAHKELIQSMKIDDTVSFCPTSCMTQEGVDSAKSVACELLLAERVEKKISQNKVDAVKQRIHISGTAAPSTRPACIPQAVLAKAAAAADADEDEVEEEQIITEKHLQEMHGGAGVFSVDWRKRWDLIDSSWKYDKLPEVMDGHNVMDFIDEDIDRKLAELEKEEAALMWGDVDDEAEAKQWKEAQADLDVIHSKVEQKRLENRLKKNRSRDVNVRAKNKQSSTEIKEHLETVGNDMVDVSARAKTKKRAREIEEVQPEDEVPDRVDMGLPRVEDKVKAEIKKRRMQKAPSKQGKAGESDRFISVAKPKHLYSGKRSNGTTDWR